MGMALDVQPALFVSHGSPLLALDQGAYAEALRRFAGSVRPSAIAVVSAHWLSREGLFVTSSGRPETLYDFGGFPRALYELSYPARGAPELARRIVDKLSAMGLSAVPQGTRGLDHGAWIPLRLGWPEANVPVLQLSLPRELGPERLLSLGKALAPLREEGVLLVGSGGIVHNLRALQPDDAPVDPRAKAFDDWFAQKLDKLDIESLAMWPRAPEADFAVPTPEHLAPVFVVLGARRPEDRVETVFQGFQHGSLSLRTFALRPSV